MSNPTCPACHGETGVFVKTRDYNQRLSEKEFVYFQCRDCGLIFLDNVPDNLGDFYPGTYHYFPEDDEELAACAERERYKIELVKAYCPSGRLVEVGPSWGAFSWLAKQAGYDVTAIEMNPECCSYLRDRIGVRVMEGHDEIAALASIEQRVDVITLWHVIEHLGKPWEFIRAAVDRLNEGGVLVLAAPNPEAFQFKLLRSRWVHIDAPRHVTQLTPGYLRHLAESMGMECVLLTTRDKGSLGWNTFGWEYSFMNIFHVPFLRKVAFVVGKVVALFCSVFDGREGNGSAYTLVLKKTAR